MSDAVVRQPRKRGYVGSHRLVVPRDGDRFAGAVWYRLTGGKFSAKRRVDG